MSGLGSSLFEDIRVKLGASYTQGGILSIGVKNPGLFGVYVATSKEYIRQTEEALDSFLMNIVDCMDQEAFYRAKNYLLSQIEREKENYLGFGRRLALYELWGLGYEDYLREEPRIKNLEYHSMQDFLKALDFSKGVFIEVGPIEPD